MARPSHSSRASRFFLLLATALLCVALPACTALGGRTSAGAGGAADPGRGGVTVFGDIDASVGRR
jgi:hypothetical protein